MNTVIDMPTLADPEPIVKDEDRGPSLVVHDYEAYLNGREVILLEREVQRIKAVVVAGMKRAYREELKKIDAMRPKRKRRTKAEMASARAAEAAEGHTEVKRTRRKREPASA